MPGSEIDYESLAQDALRGVIRSVLARAETDGLPGEHHFYIAFDTRAEGVSLSKRLREQYPQEMTVVLQHRFWDLYVHEDSFEVKLTFGNIPERLSVPFSAIKVFFDPSVPYGLQFEASEMMAEAVKANPQIAGVVEAMDEEQDLDNLHELPLPVGVAGVEDIAVIDGEIPALEVSGEAEAATEGEAGDEGANERPVADVVDLDAFRKK